MNNRIYSFNATIKNKPKFEIISESSTKVEFSENILSPEDFDFNDYEETEYDSLEDK
jgi:hypothetical protein